MTTEQHPITPPPELVREWNEAAIGTHFPPYGYSEYIATQAARWGADQQLKADCEWLREARNHGFGYDMGRILADNLRAARRPKPPSLKEQALTQLDSLRADLRPHGIVPNTDTIRRALERLQELEEGNE